MDLATVLGASGVLVAAALGAWTARQQRRSGDAFTLIEALQKALDESNDESRSLRSLVEASQSERETDHHWRERAEKELAILYTELEKRRPRTILNTATDRPLILIVEDQDVIALLWQRLLERAALRSDYEIMRVLTANDAELFLQEATVALAIIDLSLGDRDALDGMDVVRLAQERSPRTQLIIVSGHVNDPLPGGTQPIREIAAGMGIVALDKTPDIYASLSVHVHRALRIWLGRDTGHGENEL